MMLSRSRRNLFWLMLAVVLAVPLLYVLAYLTLLDPKGPSGSYVVRPGAMFERVPHYRFGQGIAEVVFDPLLWLDQAVRPDYWRLPLSPYGPWPNHTDGAGTDDEYSHPPSYHRLPSP